MILKKETEEKFGYLIEDLSSGSNKVLIVKCDYCDKEYESSNKKRKAANKNLDKDACMGCRYRKRDEVGIKMYGGKNPFEWDHVKEKIKASNLEKFGVEYPMQSEEIRQKSKDSCMEKYGVSHPMKTVEVQEAIKKTCLEKYGSENPSGNQEVVDKRKKTNLERYGHESYLASDDCQQKLVEKYGVDNVFQLESVKDKIKLTNIEKYGVDHRNKVKELALASAAKARQTMIDNGYIKLHEGKTQAEWAEETGFSRSHFSKLVNDHGIEFAISSTPRMTIIEKKISDILDIEDIRYKKQFYVEGKFADFKIDDIIIEVDGLYWHSDKKQDDDSYHIEKREMYERNGYIPLFFREDEVLNRIDIVRSIILNKLGKSERVYARKLKIGTLGKKLGNEFFEANHLMGKGRGQIFTLYDDKEVLCAIQVCRNKGDNWEISRFCSKLGMSVVGGFSRLLSHFTGKESPDSITTFVDRRYGQGDYLQDLGFEFKSCYKSFQWTDGHSRFHRMKFRSNSGYDMGLAKIWDCGQAKYIKTLPNGV